MPAAPHPLRGACERDVRAAIEAHGPTFDRAQIVETYVDRGVGRNTIYTWISAILSGKAPAPRRTAPARLAAPPPPPAERARAQATPRASSQATDRLVPPVDVMPPMPAIPQPEDVATVGLINVLQQIHTCIAMAEKVRLSALAPDGSVRNSRLALDANERHRRCLETAARINESVMATQEMERFHRLLIEEVMKEAPAAAERIMARLRSKAETWAGRA